MADSDALDEIDRALTYALSRASLALNQAVIDALLDQRLSAMADE